MSIIYTLYTSISSLRCYKCIVERLLLYFHVRKYLYERKHSVYKTRVRNYFEIIITYKCTHTRSHIYIDTCIFIIFRYVHLHAYYNIHGGKTIYMVKHLTRYNIFQYKLTYVHVLTYTKILYLHILRTVARYDDFPLFRSPLGEPPSPLEYIVDTRNVAAFASYLQASSYIL